MVFFHNAHHLTVIKVMHKVKILVLVKILVKLSPCNVARYTDYAHLAYPYRLILTVQSELAKICVLVDVTLATKIILYH
jgi:hypothetical protein